MKTYITFGQEHVHSINGKTFDKDCVAVVNLPEEEAREIFMPEFCFSYTEFRFAVLSQEFFPKGITSVFPRGLIYVESPATDEDFVPTHDCGDCPADSCTGCPLNHVEDPTRDA
jgi:hypothetical protein